MSFRHVRGLCCRVSGWNFCAHVQGSCARIVCAMYLHAHALILGASSVAPRGRSRGWWSLCSLYSPRTATVRCGLGRSPKVCRKDTLRVPSPRAVCLTACLERFLEVLKYQMSIVHERDAVQPRLPSSTLQSKGKWCLRVVRYRARSRGLEQDGAVTKSPFALSRRW